MKVSFLLPTKNSDRRSEAYASRVIENINENCSYEKEILVYSPKRVEGENVKWFEEKIDSAGCTIGYNFLYKQSKGEYVFVNNDEYGFTRNSPEMAIRILESKFYCNKKVKILGMGSDINYFPNARITSPFTCVPNYGLIKQDYRVCGYPMFHRDTIEKYLSGYIYHPKFKHHFGDNYLPFYVGYVLKEPIEDCPLSSMKLLLQKDIVIRKEDSSDIQIYKNLISNLVSGKSRNYVEPEGEWCEED